MTEKKKSKCSKTVSFSNSNFIVSDNEREESDSGKEVLVTEATKQQDLCLEVIFTAPSCKDTSLRSFVAIKCLLDPCCTGAVITNAFAKLLISKGYVAEDD